LACSPDGKRFVSGGFVPGESQGIVHIWNVKSGDLMYTLRAEGAVQTVLFTPGGNQVVIGGEGNKVIVWTPPGE
jgi:WD40 repeat protein